MSSIVAMLPAWTGPWVDLWPALALLPLLGAAQQDDDPLDLEGDLKGEPGGPDAPEPVGDWKHDPDHEIVRAVLDGDAAAYRGLVERYQNRIYGVCFGMTRNREDARDMAQEAFVKAYRNLNRFRFGSSFYTWLCRIAMNVSIDHLRRMRVRRTEALEENDDGGDGDGVIHVAHHRGDPGKNLERKRLHGRILDALGELPEEQRQAVVLREMEGLSYKEIAEVMGIPEGTVMSRLFYARKKLQAALAEER